MVNIVHLICKLLSTSISCLEYSIVKVHEADWKGIENGVIGQLFTSTIGIKLENNDISTLDLSSILKLRNLLLFIRKNILTSLSLLLNHWLQMDKMV